MTVAPGVKKRHSAKALRDRKRLARYFHSHGYGRLSDEYECRHDEAVLRRRFIMAVIAVLVLITGLFFVIF